MTNRIRLHSGSWRDAYVFGSSHPRVYDAYSHHSGLIMAWWVGQIPSNGQKFLKILSRAGFGCKSLLLRGFCSVKAHRGFVISGIQQFKIGPMRLVGLKWQPIYKICGDFGKVQIVWLNRKQGMNAINGQVRFIIRRGLARWSQANHLEIISAKK